MKNKIVLFLTGCFLLLSSSCLDSDNDNGDAIEAPKNCLISSFKLAHDSIPGLSDVKFTIDQINGLIFNIDSMPYGTVLEEKVICTVEYLNTYTVESIEVQQGDDAELVTWNRADSLDFSKPVKFVITAYDGLTRKSYWAQLNIHQQVPDSMVWSLYADQITGQSMKEQKVITYDYSGSESYFMYTKSSDANKGYQLFYSLVSDAKNWSELPLSGLPASDVYISQITEYEGVLYLSSSNGTLYQSTNGRDWSVVGNTPAVKYLLGSVREGQNQPSALTAIIENSGVLTFAAMSKDKVWSTGDVVPSGFPISGFDNLHYYNMYHEYLMVAAGRDKDNKLLNSTWGTMNGKVWAQLTDAEIDNFGKKEGVMLAAYDEKYFLIGGIDEAGKPSKDIHISIDHGVTWSLIDTMVVLPDSYKARGFSSVQVDKDQYMLIFGGKTTRNGNDLDEIWRGRINRLGFKK